MVGTEAAIKGAAFANAGSRSLGVGWDFRTNPALVRWIATPEDYLKFSVIGACLSQIDVMSIHYSDCRYSCQTFGAEALRPEWMTGILKGHLSALGKIEIIFKQE